MALKGTESADSVVSAFSVTSVVLTLAKLDLTRSLMTEECQQYLHVEQCP